MPRFYAPIEFSKFEDMIKELGLGIYDLRDWLTKGQVGKDLSKVEFDMENVHAGSLRDTKCLGLNQWGDFCFLGIAAGGDWEQPVFMIVYWDGKQLRGYIPKDGNPWNRKTKRAYGNDDEEDLKDMIKQKYVSPDTESVYGMCLEFNDAKIKADIRNRITRKSVS